jgi:hypothetical protein
VEGGWCASKEDGSGLEGLVMAEVSGSDRVGICDR